jgi:hypothetical protein
MAKIPKKKPSDAKRLVKKEIFTTFDVSRICQANIASIKNWIMKGYLKAFRTPGGHYRIQKKDLINFLRKYHMPNPFSGEMLRLYFFSKDHAAGEKICAEAGRGARGLCFRGRGRLVPSVLLI